MTEIGQLIDVSLKEAWAREASDFTPWLANNLERLGDSIGINLELEGSEVAVGGFSADILARNPQDDSLVLIENQLEGTDHKHLGQILTYLAGLDAKVIVWIAAGFRDEHLSAIKWLNEHTKEDFSFFAVMARAVRIGDSAIAPLFEVVERPNNWERHIKEVSDAKLSELSQFRLDFWTHYENRFPDEKARGATGAVSSRWRILEEYELAISSYVAQKSVGVFVRPLRGVETEQAIEILEPHRREIAAIVGSDIWHEERKHFFVVWKDANTRDQANWDELCDWLYETANRLEGALHSCFKNEDGENRN